MRPYFVISLIIAGALALAQSNPVSPSSQNHTEIPPSVSRFPQRFPFGQPRARTVKPGMSHSEVSMRGLSFANVVTYGTGGYDAMSVAVADVNGDGKPDIVVANYCTSGNQSGCTNGAGVVGVLLNNGDGTFKPVVTYSSGGNNADSVVVADVNGDGKPDIVVANYGSGGVAVLLNNGDGTFKAAVSYGSGGAAPASVAVADVNGDGKLALLVANEDANDVGVLLGNGDGTFQPAVAYDLGAVPLSVAAADLRGDGKVDAIVAECASFDLNDCLNQPSLVGVLLGNGDGTFQPVVNNPSGGAYPTSIAVGDVNGDGKPDVLATNAWSCGNPPGCSFGSVLGVLIGNGDGNFQNLVIDDLGAWLSEFLRVAVADVNGDGKLDAVVTTGAVEVLLGNGDGTFQPAVTYDSGGSSPDSVAVADVNGDGRPDLVVANYCENGNCSDGGPGVVGVLINTSTEDFSLAPSSSSSATVTPGQTAKYTVAVSPDGGFGQTVTLTCTGAPAQSRCSVSPSSVRLNGSKSTSVSVSVSTAGNSAGITYPGNLLSARAAVWLALSGLSGLVLLGGQKGRSRGCGRLFCALAFLCLFSLVIMWPACGGSGGGGSSSSSGTGTPPGTYTVTVTGTFKSGSTTLSHSTKLTLIVQ